MAIIVTCGHRCPRHNLEIGGVALSRHTSGEAIDIAAAPLLEVFTVEQVIDMATKAGFTFTDYYERMGFFHLDVRNF